MTTPSRIAPTRAHQIDSQRTYADAVPTYREARKGSEIEVHATQGGERLEVAPPDTGVCSRILASAILCFQTVIYCIPR